MSRRDVSFTLDIQAASVILTDMAAPVVKQKAEAIAARARSMAGSMTSNPPDISVTTGVGIIKRGNRAIATIRAAGNNARANYIGNVALSKSKDAGR